MKLAISNIAWDVEEEDVVAAQLHGWGARAVEVAPTRLWPDLSRTTPEEVSAYRRYWEDHGLAVSSMQALLYGRPDLRLFDTDAVRDAMLGYLDHALDVGAGLGARVLVFGSPKNRQRGDLDREQAEAIALDFFARLGERAVERGVAIGLEANPTDYQCDFLTRHEELASFVRKLDHPGVVHHFDLGGAILAGDDEAAAIEAGWPLAHVHLSEPFLNGIGEHPPEHERLARALEAMRYRHWISIESRRDPADPIGRVRRALEFVQGCYLDDPPGHASEK